MILGFGNISHTYWQRRPAYTQQFIDKGQLIPDELMIEILASVYDSLCPCEGVIFDGFPRTIPQAEALKEMLAILLHGTGGDGAHRIAVGCG